MHKIKHKIHKKVHHYSSLFFIATVAFVALVVYFHVTPMSLAKYSIDRSGRVLGVSSEVTVSVSSNSYNTLAAQLQEKENNLKIKEQKLEEKEAMLYEKNQQALNKNLAYLVVISLILLCLILLNFYLDYRRRHQLHYS